MAENRKVAFITGGSQGIGRAIAEEFARNGYATAICARTQEDVEKAAGEIASRGFGCEGIALDVTDQKAVASAMNSVAKKYGGLDVLVTCAGVYGPIGRLEENDWQKWQEAISINLIGTMLAIRAALPIMKKQGKGCIITMAGGGVGGKGVKPNFSSYVTSKFAVCGFTEAMAAELEGSGVRINSISPGAVNTRLLDQALASGKNAGEEFLKASAKQKETGGTPPKQAARLALFLASDEARSVDGKMLSAVWDDTAEIARMGDKIRGPLFTLKRIDNALFQEKKRD